MEGEAKAAASALALFEDFVSPLMKESSQVHFDWSKDTQPREEINETRIIPLG